MKCYVDSSFDLKKGVAGIGIVIENGEKQRIISNWIPCNSNNYGELYAIYIASILTSGQATIYTDSECALAYLNKKTNEERPRTYAQYVEHHKMRLLAYKIRRLNPNVQKVKAHTKQVKFLEIGNAMADLLAKQGRCKYYASKGVLSLYLKKTKSKSLT